SAVDIVVPALELLAQIARLVILSGLADLGETHVLGEEMRRHEHEAAHAMILHAAGINGRNRSAVAIAEEDAALEANSGQHLRQPVNCPFVHEAPRAGQLAGARFAVTGAGIDEHARARGGRKLFGQSAPKPDAAKALMQHDDGRRLGGPWPDPAIFEPQRSKIEEALVRKRHAACSPSKRATMPSSFVKLCSTASPEVSISASARA